MKHSIELLRRHANVVRTRVNNLYALKEQMVVAEDYERTANLLEQIVNSGEPGSPNQAQAATRESTILDSENLLTAALFVGINPKAAHNLVGLVKYIQNLEAALLEKRTADVG